ncbi:hypothetical protein PINS_up014760 [Pythium insidiosum]|nr:hypothetical protein PINS_up014760 [Pythium insidiosum]
MAQDKRDEDPEPSLPPPKRPRFAVSRRGCIGYRPQYRFRLVTRSTASTRLRSNSNSDNNSSKDHYALRVALPLDRGSPLRESLCVVPDTVDVVHLKTSYGSDDDDDETIEATRVLGVVSTDWIRDACFELMAKDVISMDLSRCIETGEFQWKICVDWKAYMASTGPHDGLAFPSLRDGKPHRAMRDFMAWLLWRSRATTQWRYAFEDELDALYRRVVVREWPSRPCGFEIHDVYAQIDVKAQLARDTSNLPAEIVVSGPLLATLRPYQRAAVSWMLAREKGTPRCVKSAVPTRCVQFLTPENLFFDPFCARFYQTTEDPSLALGSSDLNNLNGGILADEMGLGKTVEVISLVLSHRAPSTELRIVRDAGALSSNSGMHEDEVASTDIVSPDSVACICRSAAHVESGWIQCERCFTWHHRVCTGLTESEDDDDAAPQTSAIPRRTA